MTDELFDVVNEADEVVGQKPRSEVHRSQLLHRAVHVLVINARGRVFLQKRSRRKDTFPGAWDSSASGHLEAGESYDDAAARELNEEIGLRPGRPLERLFKVDACSETGFEFVWVYRCDSDGPIQLNRDEIDEGGWFEPARVSQWSKDRPNDFARAWLLIWPRFLTATRIASAVLWAYLFSGTRITFT